ncbi:MAG: alpha-glucan family phosphorylase [Terriglobia bacterium]
MATTFNSPQIAYFSMEIALDPAIPTYAGGLGVLAGDTLRSAADLGVPMVGLTLVHRKGYFEQRLDEQGNQTEQPVLWNPEQLLEPTKARASVTIEGRPITISAWRYSIKGISGQEAPVYLLDTALPENTPWDQTLTDHLYGGDDHYRLCQEVVLGMGGVEILCALGCPDIKTYHMNEGHSALLSLALIDQGLRERDLSAATEKDIEEVRKKCIFTTHTPVPAGHDKFSKDMMRSVLGEKQSDFLERMDCLHNNVLNMTYLALRFSHYINGVAMHHGEISRGMFPNYPVRAITNGVHAVTWTAPSFRELYDRHIPEWRRDNLYLRYAIGISLGEILEAHARAKQSLLEEVKNITGAQLDSSVMTIGFARRMATYKRADLFFSDLERLKQIVHQVGPVQIVYAGKAHPRDQEGKALIRRVFEAADLLGAALRVVYLPNYGMRWGHLITSGVDLWLNTPQRPQEASGTSGMKAALNGVPSFSVPDGWWVEGHVEGITGWEIGREELPDNPGEEIMSLYDKLEFVILPMFYGRPSAFAEVMRLAIALNGSFFNTQRMVAQYVANAYFPRI